MRNQGVLLVAFVVVMCMDHNTNWRLSSHFFSTSFELSVEALGLEALENLRVGMLGLAIASWVHDACKIHA
jgi:hypothetical protein